jgi:hypothetical protein
MTHHLQINLLRGPHLCAGIRSIGEMAVSLAGVDSSDFILSEVDLLNDFLSHIASDSKEHQV